MIVHLVETDITGLTLAIVPPRQNVIRVISGGLNIPVGIPHPLTTIATTEVTKITLNGTAVVEMMTIGTQTIILIMVTT